jgi:hypothetical protein
MWQIEKNLQEFSDDVNNFIVDFLNIYADLDILTFRVLSR